MPLETYLLYLSAVAIFFATPPDTSQLLIISNSIRHGLRRSLLTIAGDLSANTLQMAAAGFGLAAVVATSATAFAIIKWVGVAYLLWIGVQLILSQSHNQPDRPEPATSRLHLFRQGFVTSMANPFAVVFFGALFPQFIDPTVAIAPQLLILGSTYLIVDGLILLAWGWLGRRAADGLKRITPGLVNKICGGLMVGAAILLANKDLQPQK